MFKNAEELVSSAWRLSPKLALRILKQCSYALKTRFSALSRLVNSYLTFCPCFDSVVFAIQNIEDTQICYIDPPSIPALLVMLGTAKPLVTGFARRMLARISVEAQLFYLPQIIQLGILQEEGEAALFLRDITSKSHIVRTRADWLLLSFDSSPALALRNFITLPTDIQNSFLHRLAKVALTLVPKDPANAQLLIERVAVAETQSGVNISHLEFPLDPELLITGLEPRATRPLRSAKRVPMLVQLRTEDKKTREKLDTSVIIKVNDDTRNDQLTLQFIELADSIFRSHGVPCYLRPYKILPLNIDQAGTQYLGCLMEVVPDCKSRDELWSEGFETLLNYFSSIAADTDLTRLRQNFTESMAAYSLLSYLLQIKDRHNGNLLFDAFGHIVHIDFGFILSLSPGGNAGVENVEFKLTNEMVEALTSLDAFKRLFMTGFFVLQEYATELSAVFDLMKTSGIGCFTPGAVNELHERFWTGKSRAKTAEKLVQMVYWAQDSMYTRMYDRMQKASQNIQS